MFWRQNITCLIFILFSGIFHPFDSQAQNGHGIYDTIIVNACIESNGDTIPCSWLDEVYVTGKLYGKWKRVYHDWTRLRNAVYVTYPYAKSASKVMNEINAQLVNVQDKNLRKQIILSREADLKREFADKIQNLSVYQGKVLMKLIYRNTGNNCYEIIDSYKGRFNAAFWQTIALLFGSNLRQNYYPTGKDKVMEMIVKDVQQMYGDYTYPAAIKN